MDNAPVRGIRHVYPDDACVASDVEALALRVAMAKRRGL
jgi:hypothetical protein